MMQNGYGSALTSAYGSGAGAAYYHLGPTTDPDPTSQ